MKTIKIFLASSEELIDDRNAFGNLVRRLDKIYEKRGIRIELFEWEDYDAAYNDCRKQDEYNEQIKASDMFLALFHTKAGKFTIEEFDVATEEFRKKSSPKIYAYCHDLRPGEVETPELIEFKRRLFEEMGHYWSRYGNRDTMQLHFVMQLQLVETGNREMLKIENGEVFMDNMHIASMDNLPFVTQNEGYQKMKAELKDLSAKIEKARIRTEKYPEDEDFRDDLQSLLDRNNALKEELDNQQKALFDTAKRISEIQQKRLNKDLQWAISEFEMGHIEAANTIIAGIEREAEHHVEQLDRFRSIVEQDIDALLLKTNTLMADSTIPIESRISQVVGTYEKAEDWAQKCNMDFKKYSSLLMDYGQFLYMHDMHDKALEIWTKECTLSLENYGKIHYNTAISYNCIGNIFRERGDFTMAMTLFQNALNIYLKLYGLYDLNTATCYHNIASVYFLCNDNNQAISHYQKALEIYNKIEIDDHLYVAATYNEIGAVYTNLEMYDISLNYLHKSLTLYIKILGMEHPFIAACYINIGRDCMFIRNYDESLEYFKKALIIREKKLGPNHRDTAQVYNNIGHVYLYRGNYDKALEYYQRTFVILEKSIGVKHPYTIGVKENIEKVKEMRNKEE